MCHGTGVRDDTLRGMFARQPESRQAVHVFNAIGGDGSPRDCGCLFGFLSYMIVLAIERSPEKAGVGGSTPSLATIIPKGLGDFARFRQPKVQPKMRH